jgi:hypothetical protein
MVEWNWFENTLGKNKNWFENTLDKNETLIWKYLRQKQKVDLKIP